MDQTVTDTLLALGGAGLSVGGLAYAAMWPESQIFGRVLVAGSDPNEVALTFDDGPNGDTTLRLLDILARHEARATFFLIGRFVLQEPHIVRLIAQAGHLIGNHTMTHPWLHLQTARRIREELGGCKAALEDTLGAPVRFFRPPHGSRRPYVIEYARELGMETVNWNVIVEDWKGAPSAVLLTRLESGISGNRAKGRGSNVLLHDGGDRAPGIGRQATLEATDRLLAWCGERGVRMVTVDKWSDGFCDGPTNVVRPP